MKIDNLEKLLIKTIESIKTETDINAFLTFAGHGNLHNLSIENLLAVYGQNPEAVLVGSFNQWKSEAGTLSKDQVLQYIRGILPECLENIANIFLTMGIPMEGKK